MGCCSAKNLPPDENNNMNNVNNNNIFSVTAVDFYGVRSCEGHMEVTENDLKFHEKGGEPIVWPLDCVKTHGSKKNLFIFESGSQCPTGANNYKFLCDRAVQLDCLVYKTTQNLCRKKRLNFERSQAVVDNTSVVDHRSLNRRTSAVDSQSDQHLSQTDNTIEEAHSSRTPINTRQNQARPRLERIDECSLPLAPPPPELEDTYVPYLPLAPTPPKSKPDNTGEVAMAPSPPESDEDDYVPFLPCTQPKPDAHDVLEKISEEDANSYYINVDAEGRVKDNAPSSESEPDYIDMDAGNTTFAPHPSPASMNSTDELVSRHDSKCNLLLLSYPEELNYIELDFKSKDGVGALGASAASSSLPDLSSKYSDNYSLIDFKRTLALSNLSKAVIEKGAVRKTRHNSTLN